MTTNETLNTSDVWSLHYNLTDNVTTADERPRADDARRILNMYGFGVAPMIIIPIGCIGNILTLVVLNRGRHFQAVSYIYLRWLALVDLLSMIIWVPVIMFLGWRVPIRSESVATYYASFHLLLHNSFLASSAFLVVALTVERLVSVRFPTKAKTLVTHNRAKKFLVITFFTAIALHVLYSFEDTYAARTNPKTNETFYVILPRYSQDHDMTKVLKVYHWVIAILTKFLPIIIVAGLNTWTVWAFYRHGEKKQKLSQGSKQEKKQRKEQQRIMIMLMCVMIIFVICLLPMPFLYIFYNQQNLRIYAFNVFRVVANLLETSNSAVNFYVYCLASADFRKHLRLAFSECTGWVHINRGVPAKAIIASSTAIAAGRTCKTMVDDLDDDYDDTIKKTVVRPTVTSPPPNGSNNGYTRLRSPQPVAETDVDITVADGAVSVPLVSTVANGTRRYDGGGGGGGGETGGDGVGGGVGGTVPEKPKELLIYDSLSDSELL